MDVPLSPDPVCEFEAHVASPGDVDFRPPAFSEAKHIVLPDTRVFLTVGSLGLIGAASANRAKFFCFFLFTKRRT